MLFKHRLHGIELLDNPRCPRVIRDGALDYLQFIIRTGNAYGPVAPVLARTLASSNTTKILDLCSGGGGPWPALRQEIVREGAASDSDVVLTDLFPNVDAFREISVRDPHVRGDPASTDIERGDVKRPGVRTLFSCFHHFRPATALGVLRNVTRYNDAVFIAEVTERRLAAMLFMLLAPLLVWIATPALRPFRWSRLFFTYLLPAIPFVVCFDGIVSCLRTYTPDELQELLTTLDDLPYAWEVGQARGRGPMAVTYAVGLPAARSRVTRAPVNRA